MRDFIHMIHCYRDYSKRYNFRDCFITVALAELTLPQEVRDFWGQLVDYMAEQHITKEICVAKLKERLQKLEEKAEQLKEVMEKDTEAFVQRGEILKKLHMWRLNTGLMTAEEDIASRRPKGEDR